MHARLPSLIVLVAVAVACNGEDLGPNISGVPAYGIVSVEIVPPLDTIVIGDTITESDQLQLTAIATSRKLTPIQDLQFFWESSNVAVATVDSGGLVTPVAAGTTTITASAGKIGHATIVVQHIPALVLPVP